MILKDLLTQIKDHIYIKIIVNGKFFLFDCYKKNMNEHVHASYIEDFLDLEVDFYETTFEHLGKKTKKIYLTSEALEDRCLQLEDYWYNQNHNKLEYDKVIAQIRKRGEKIWL